LASTVVEDHGVIAIKLLATNGGEKQIALDGADGFQLWRMADRLGQSGKRCLVGLKSIDCRRLSEREREGAEPGEKVGDAFGAARPFTHQFRHHRLGLCRGLKESARR
jgi:hypothetical protein